MLYLIDVRSYYTELRLRKFIIRKLYKLLEKISKDVVDNLSNILVNSRITTGFSLRLRAFNNKEDEVTISLKVLVKKPAYKDSLLRL